jgi:hypothetical protein
MLYPIYQTRTENVLTATPPGVRDTLTYLSSTGPIGSRVGEACFVASKSDLERFACSIDAPAGVDDGDQANAELLEELGVPDTRETRENLETVLAFLVDKCGHDESMIATYLRAIDLQSEVKAIEIPQGRVLLGIESTGSNRKKEMEGEFFAKPGATLRFGDASPVKFFVKAPTNALLTSPTDTSPVSGRAGDAAQFIIPASEVTTNLYVALLQSGRTTASQKPPRGARGTNRR